MILHILIKSNSKSTKIQNMLSLLTKMIWWSKLYFTFFILRQANNICVAMLLRRKMNSYNDTVKDVICRLHVCRTYLNMNTVHNWIIIVILRYLCKKTWSLFEYSWAYIISKCCKRNILVPNCEHKMPMAIFVFYETIV